MAVISSPFECGNSTSAVQFLTSLIRDASNRLQPVTTAPTRQQSNNKGKKPQQKQESSHVLDTTPSADSLIAVMEGYSTDGKIQPEELTDLREALGSGLVLGWDSNSTTRTIRVSSDSLTVSQAADTWGGLLGLNLVVC